MIGRPPPRTPRATTRRPAWALLAATLAVSATGCRHEPFVMPQPELDRLADEDERERQYERHKVVRSRLHFSTAATPDPPRYRTDYRTFFARYEETAALYQRALQANLVSIGLSGASLVFDTVLLLDLGLTTENSPGILRRPGEITVLGLNLAVVIGAVAALGVGIGSIKQLEERYNFNLRRELRLNEAKYWRPPPGVELSLAPGGLVVRW